MKRIFLGLALAAGAAVTFPASAQVGVSINIGEPGFYGQIDLGEAPPPRVIYAQPRVVERTTVVEEPIYLHVPPGHAKHWSKHCREYNACGRPVYFVRDDWYQQVYLPRYREHHDYYEGRRHGYEGHDRHRDDDDHDHDDHGDHGHHHGHD